MPQFPDWKRPIAVVTDAAQVRQSQVVQFASDLAAQGRETTGEVSARAFGLVERTRSRATEFPRAMADELRRRVNVLNLATKHDVEVQGRLGRNRVSVVVKEFLEVQRRHDEELLEAFRTELREELQSFATAIDDDLFAADALPPSETGVPRHARPELDYIEDDDDIIDLTEDELTMLEATDG